MWIFIGIQSFVLFLYFLPTVVISLSTAKLETLQSDFKNVSIKIGRVKYIIKKCHCPENPQLSSVTSKGAFPHMLKSYHLLEKQYYIVGWLLSI